MGDIKTIITTNVKPNGKGEITGEVLQGVLCDMVDDYNEVVAGDVSALEDALSAETTARKEADATLTTDLATEVTERKSAIEALDKKVDTNTAAISAETAARTEADTALQTAIEAEASTRQNSDTALYEGLLETKKDVAANATAIATETSDRKAAITELTNNVASSISELSTAVDESIKEEANTRKEADDDIVSQCNIEVQARKDADDLLQAAINAEVKSRADADTALQNALLSETNERKAADTALQADIDTRLKASISLTWSALKALRDGSSLVAGQYYRITDYQTTTAQAETRAAGHQFDVIVRADDSNTLNENAWAAFHYGESGSLLDTYFENCDLNAWQLKYCLDNDTTRFAWADETNGKGVIWWMKDEWNNECFYDFKNIQYKRYKVTAVSSEALEDAEYEGKYVGVYGNEDLAGLVTSSEFQWVYTFNLFTFATQGDPTSEITATEDSSVVQKDIDYDAEDDKTAPDAYHYFRKCMCNRFGRFTMSEIVDDESHNLDFLPNFSCIDYALNYDENQEDLFTVHYGYNNYISDGCYGVTLGTEVSNVKIGGNCKTITCGNDCSYWTCGNNCYSWTCGNDCSYWTCGNYCYSWTCGNYCDSWTCGNDCSYWTCGNYCYSWTCGNDCSYWTCGNYCYSWTCGNNCYSWTCGNSCNSWTCGNFVNKVAVPQDYVSYFRIESGTQYVSIKSSGTPTSSSPLKNFVVKAGFVGTNNARIALTIDTAQFPLNSNYEWTIAKNSSGEIVQYCEADEYQINLTASDNIDNLKINKNWAHDAGVACTGTLPSEVTTADIWSLEVVVMGGSYVKQTLSVPTNGSVAMYVRVFNGTSWGAWA